MKRVNILITEEQYKQVHDLGLSLSGLVRDLITDRFGKKTIVVTVPVEVRALYDKLVSNFGVSDYELAPYVVEALERFLTEKGSEISKLQDELETMRRALPTKKGGGPIS